MRPVINRQPLQHLRPPFTVAARPRLSAPAIVRRPPLAVFRDDRARIAHQEFAPNPYVDYRRQLTAEGGILLTFKTLDLRFRHTVRRLLLWSLATGWAAWFLWYHSPIGSLWINLGCLLLFAILAWWIVKKPVERHGAIEIRPDALVVDGDIFWLRLMENGWPSFRGADHGGLTLGGIYGTRQVDYLTVYRVDDSDRTPEILRAHLADAMQQLWSWQY